MGEYVYVWRFVVERRHRSAFRHLYGADGEWCRLFRESPGYIGTELLEDVGRAGVYLTIDRWRSRADCEAMRRSRSPDFDELDRRGEELTARGAHRRIRGAARMKPRRA